jgi:hypothetical protein
VAPTLVTTPYNVNSVLTGSGDTATLTTASFTPSNGEVIVAKGQTWGSGPTLGAPTGGSQTYTQRLLVNPGGFAIWGVIYTAVISGSPGSMTISMTVSATCAHSMVVERWSAAQLAATPATATASYSSASLPSMTITTAANGSIVSVLNGDEQSIAPGTPGYSSSGTQDGLANGAPSGNSVQYYWYQSAPTAGSQTVGMTAPSGQKWSMGAVEIQAAATATPAAEPARTLLQAVNRASTY